MSDSHECKQCGDTSRRCATRDVLIASELSPRPIATAPKINQSRLLLFYYDAWRIGFWCDVVVDPGYTQWSDDSEEFFLMLPGPTHWLPVPPNP